MKFKQLGIIRCYQKAKDKLLGEDVIEGLTNRNGKAFRQICKSLPS